MKKLIKLLALALAVVMLLPSAAMADGEEDGVTKELWMQWLNWEEDPEPDSDVHRNSPLNAIPTDEYHIAIYTSDNNGEKLTPVPAEKLEASEGVTIYPLCPGVKGKEHYVSVKVAEWNKEYQISYDGYTMDFDSRLPDIGLYSAPEATTENYLKWGWGYSPVGENSPAYLISTCTDETHGRHLVDAALSKDEGDSKNFTLEKVSDNVYKIAMTGSVDAQIRRLRVDITWQNVKFMGGNTYTELFDYEAWENASLLVSEKPVTKYDYDNPDSYYDVKADFTDEITLKAGESKDVYVAFTYFNEDEHNDWIMRNVGVSYIVTKDSGLKLTTDKNDPYKLTVSADKPGTYSIVYYDNIYPVVDAVYHKDGKKFTNEEFWKWDTENTYAVVREDGEWKMVIIEDLDKWYESGEGWATPEEACPDEKIEYHIAEVDPWRAITVTVEAAEEPTKPEETSKPVSFTDVAKGAWYEKAVAFASGKGYMNGSTAKTFNPQGQITGAEFAQILYNKEGKPAVADGASFKGVKEQWYAPAILWASGKGIITDAGDTAIDPEKPLTRQQIALMLYNALDKPEGTADLSGFADAGQISAWAKPAMEWAVSAKVFQGSGGKLNPANTATRAEVAQILMNYFG